MNPSEGRNQAVKTVTMATVARVTGVSQGAISSLLNDRDYGIRVSPGTRKKVFETCRQLGYVPNDLRAIVRMYPERGDLGVLWPARAPDLLGDAFGPRFLQGVRAGSGMPGALMTLVEFPGTAGGGLLPKAILDGIVSRVITVGALEAAVAETLRAREIRHVAVESDPTGSGVTVLHPDYHHAAFLALQHLHQAGHRNIAVITSDSPGFALREKLLGAGVKAAARELRLTIDRTIACQPNWRFEDGPSIAAKLSSSPLQVTAAFCYSEEVAAGLIASIQAQGRRIPEALSVIGCGNASVGRQIYPALTTIHIPIEEMGEKAVHLLTDPAPSTENARTIIFPVELMSRATVSPPKG